jgi:hypothetical protein
MHSIRFVIPALIALALPFTASAHQVAVFEIGGSQYQFVVGSLNEPIAVDDNTGFDFRVSMPGHESMSANEHHGAGGAVTGLEETLQVELIAGDKRKTFDLTPVHGAPGSYFAKFYPTVATTLSYRVFGTLNNTAIDLTFTCRAEGAEGANEGEKEISAGVKQLSKVGGFSCPAEREALGFPEESAPIAEVSSTASTANGMSVAGLALGAAALAIGFMRRRS